MKYLKIYESFVDNTISSVLFRRHGVTPYNELKELYLYNTNLNSLDGIENLVNLSTIHCDNNNLKNLKGIENCTKLEKLYCQRNLLANLDEIKNLKNIKTLKAWENPWELPLPVELLDKFGDGNLYLPDDMERFSKYEFQKEFLTKYPERFSDLKPIGIHEKIREEFPDLVEGSEFGFFNLR